MCSTMDLEKMRMSSRYTTRTGDGVTQHIINQGLENGWSICKFKRHATVLIMSIRGVERCISLVFLSNAHQIVRVP